MAFLLQNNSLNAIFIFVHITHCFLIPFTQEQNRGKRFDFLLEQTEIFSHFMSSATSAKAPSSPLKMKPGRPKKNPDPHTLIAANAIAGE